MLLSKCRPCAHGQLSHWYTRRRHLSLSTIAPAARVVVHYVFVPWGWSLSCALKLQNKCSVTSASVEVTSLWLPANSFRRIPYHGRPANVSHCVLYSSIR